MPSFDPYTLKGLQADLLEKISKTTPDKFIVDKAFALGVDNKLDVNVYPTENPQTYYYNTHSDYIKDFKHYKILLEELGIQVELEIPKKKKSNIDTAREELKGLGYNNLRIDTFRRLDSYMLMVQLYGESKSFGAICVSENIAVDPYDGTHIGIQLKAMENKLILAFLAVAKERLLKGELV